MKIISYNVNGIRAAIAKDWVNWLRTENPDIIGLQEIKAEREQLDFLEIEQLGYTVNWFSAQKKGYSGVALFSKLTPDLVETGIGDELFDHEGRVIRLDFGDLTVINAYFPSGTSGETRQGEKYRFLDVFYTWIQNLKATRPNLIVMGDYNIAHTELDIHDPKGNKKSSGFLPEEREWMTKFLSPESGFIDPFRQLNPEPKKYSWWSYRFNARTQNKGWRIDYICVTEPLKARLMSSDLLNDVIHSDHCPACLVITD
jgi:exodeoxyribonuclease-3